MFGSCKAGSSVVEFKDKLLRQDQVHFYYVFFGGDFSS